MREVGDSRSTAATTAAGQTDTHLVQVTSTDTSVRDVDRDRAGLELWNGHTLNPNVASSVVARGAHRTVGSLLRHGGELVML